MVLDTCSMFWWTMDPERLSSRAAREIKPSNHLIVSSISIWEIGIKVKKGKLEIPISIDEYVTRLKRISVLEIVPVDEVIWLRNLQLEWDHRDPADRTIVATAEILGLPIVTPDRIIADYYPRTIW